MAILKGIEASVVIDGKALTEYDDEDTPDESFDHTSEVSKYIEAVSDAEFSIDYTVPRSYNFVGNALSFKCSLDGVWVRTGLCLKADLEDLRKDRPWTIAGSNVKNGEEWYLRPFKFDDIKIGETSLHISVFCIDREIQWKRQLQRLAAGRAKVSPISEPSRSMSLTHKLLAGDTAPATMVLNSVNHLRLRRRSSKVETSRFRLSTRTRIC